MGYNPWDCKESDTTEHMHRNRHRTTSRFVKVVTNGKMSFFLPLGNNPCVCVCMHTYFLYLSFDVHLGCFHVLTIENDAAANTGVR